MFSSMDALNSGNADAIPPPKMMACGAYVKRITFIRLPKCIPNSFQIFLLLHRRSLPFVQNRLLFRCSV